MKCLALMSLTALCMATGTAGAEVIPGTERNVLGWDLAAYDRGGRFSHCGMYTSYRSGITMHFGIYDNYQWSVGWSHQSWNLTPGGEVKIALYVDGIGPHNLTAVARSKVVAYADLPATAGVFDLMRKGYQMMVYAQGTQYRFSLDGTYAALTELISCVSRFTQKASAPAPIVPPVSQSTPPKYQVSAEERLEATKVVANILAQSEMTGFRILTARDIADLKSDYFSTSDVVWRAEGVVGTLRIIPKSVGVTAKDIATVVVANDLKNCKGQSVSGSTKDEKNGAVVRMFTGCHDNGEAFEARYTVVPLENGSFYLFGTVAKTSPGVKNNEAAKAETLLRQAVYEVMKR